MKVSIIIPLYNKAPYVRRALESVSAQTFEGFEAIVVDDGSTDDGAAIVSEYADARFRLIGQANAGPGAARNAGLAEACGEFVAFLDADDEWLPNYLEESLKLIEDSSADVASVTSGYIEHPRGLSTENLWRKRGITNGIHRVNPDSDPWRVVSMLAYMSPCSTVARAKVIRRWGGFFDRERCAFGEDAFLWLKLLLNETVMFNLTPLVRFHREAAGLSKNLNGARPVEPFLQDPSRLEGACPPQLQKLLNKVLAIRAAKTACVLGYWGHWRQARALVQRFTSAKNWRLPYHLPAVVCSTPIGPFFGGSWRAVSKPLVLSGRLAIRWNGHVRAQRIPAPQRSEIKLLAMVEATSVNAVAKNVMEFHRAVEELHKQSAEFPHVTVSAVTFDRNGNTAEFVNAARQQGLQVDVIRERGRFDLSIIPSLARIVEHRAPDIIVTHQVKSHFLMKLSRLWQKYPWVAFNHGYTATDLKVRLYNQLDRWSLPKADRVITVCEAFARELVKAKGISRDRILVQQNSIAVKPRTSVEEVRALRKRLGVAEDERVVLAVGRLSKEKGQVDLIKAFKELREIQPDIAVRLIIVGDGPEREKLETFAAALGIDEAVIFTGHVSNVQPYYSAANVLANASHSEGSPYVLLEAMVAGLPIVATAVGGVAEMVKDQESALLVPSRDTRTMAQAIARVLADKNLAQTLTTNAFALVTRRYSPAAYARSLIDVYRNVMLCRMVVSSRVTASS